MATVHWGTKELAFAAAWVGLSAAIAVGQESKAGAPTDPPLAGPRVAEPQKTRPTLVARDFSGRLVRPEEPAEVAAFKLLKVDEAGAARVRALLDKRAAVLDAFVTENLELLVQLNSAGAAGNKLDQLDLAAKGFSRLKPLRDAMGGKTLQAAVRELLPPEHAAEFDRVLREYWDAVAKEGRAKPKPDGKYAGRLEVIAAARLESFGQEIGRAFERMLRSGDLILKIVVGDLGLSDEQLGKIRTIVAEFVEKYGENSDKQQQGWLVLRVAAELTPKQRIEFIKKLKALGK